MRRLTRTLTGAIVAFVVALSSGCTTRQSNSEIHPSPPLTHYTSVRDIAAATSAQQRADRFGKIHLTALTGGSPAQTLIGDGVIYFDPSGPRVQLTQSMQPLNTAPGPAFTLLIFPDQAYLKPPTTLGVIPAGKSWIHISDDPTSPTVTQFNQLVQSLRDSVEPARALSAFADNGSTVKSTDDTLDGVPAVRYVISPDRTTAMDGQNATSEPPSSADASGSGGPTTNITLWLDARDRPLRLVLTRTTTSAGATRATYVITARYHDWGQPVDLPTPRPEEVVGN